MSKTKIEWADRVWNPVTGCTKISPGCLNCYAERMSNRFGEKWGLPKNDPFKVMLHPVRLFQPLRWTKPSRVFVCSMSDLFHEDVPDEYIGRVFGVMAQQPEHTFMVLTKRPERMLSIISDLEFENVCPIPIPNIWLGVTVENQEQAEKRIPLLLQTPAAKRFISVEPMLSAIDLEWPKGIYPDGPPMCCSGYQCGCYGLPTDPPLIYGIDWIICGGESGAGARPMHPNWVRGLRDQCLEYKVPFMFKQWGEWVAEDQSTAAFELMMAEAQGCVFSRNKKTIVNGASFFKTGKKDAGRLLDGQLWDQYPK